MRTITLIALLICATLSLCHAQRETYILVHGAWHGAWCWKKVVPLLEAKGNTAIAVDLPGHGIDTTSVASVTFDDYVNKVVNEANRQSGQIILVGHSMAGVVIAQAAERLGPEKVSRLIFLDAFMPQNGESVLVLADKAGKAHPSSLPPEQSLFANLVFSDDKKTSTLKTAAVKQLFYHDCSPADVTFAEKHLGSQPMVCLAAPVVVTEGRYGIIPKYYILCTQAKDLDKSDVARNVPTQRLYKLESSHSPFFSMPEKLTEMLITP
jgi:pimeloyl-ACP methyl ester carboxylesterase